MRTPNGACGSGSSSSSPTAPPGTWPSLPMSALTADALELGQRVVDHRLRAVAVGDDRPRHPVLGEVVAERADASGRRGRRRSPAPSASMPEVHEAAGRGARRCAGGRRRPRCSRRRARSARRPEGRADVTAEARPPAPRAVYPPAMEFLRPAARVTMSATADCDEQLPAGAGRPPPRCRHHDVAGSEITRTRCTGGGTDGACRRPSVTPADATMSDGDGVTSATAARRITVRRRGRDRLGSKAASSRAPRLGSMRSNRSVEPEPDEADREEHEHVGEPLTSARRGAPPATPVRRARPTPPARAGTHAGRSPWPMRRRSTKPSTSVPRRYAALWPRPRAATLAVSLSNGEPADDHHRGADERAAAGDDRRGAAVAERVRRAREEQERAVGEQPDPERRERGGEEVGSWRLLPTASTRIAGNASATNAALTGSSRSRHAVEPPPDPIGERRACRRRRRRR